MELEAAAALLGLPVSASVAEIHRAFLARARRSHPDLLVDADDQQRRAAGLRLIELRAARDILLAARPVVPVVLDPLPAPPGSPPPRPKGIGGSVVVLLLLALLVIGVVTAQDAFRSGTVTGIFDVPTAPPSTAP